MTTESSSIFSLKLCLEHARHRSRRQGRPEHRRLHAQAVADAELDADDQLRFARRRSGAQSAA